ncbi:MAG TPA: PIG-L deacetylase family protein [Flavisolibacter sp.]|nr:PIG-L deacetylase family protein [Flavisolibacter sp.]
MFDPQRILILAPHTDDGELGCGATIAKHAEAGNEITYVAFSTCVPSLPTGLPPDTLIKECKAATRSLGIQDARFFDFEVRHFPAFRQAILEELVKLNKSISPQTVYLPAQHDVHQDHHVIYTEGLRAFKDSNVFGYELPWNNVHFAPAFFEKLAPSHVHAKQEALKAYRSQAHRRYMNPDFIAALAMVRGVQCNAPFAEAFEVYRMSN